MSTWYCRPAAREWSTPAPADPAVLRFHRSLPGYRPTALVPLPTLAEELGVAQVFVKDESARLGLPAFKILGASWAATRALEHSPGAVVVSATDGNHGRALARIAALRGTTAEIFVPAVMLDSTVALIESEGARVTRVDGDYDDAVRAAAQFATEQSAHQTTGYDAPSPGRVLVQDTAWEGYEEIPGWIVDGYDTLLAEVDEQLGREPDLVVVPAGVGSLAQAVVLHYRRRGPADDAPNPGTSRRTRVMSVEPDTAACVLTSLTTGTPATVATGDTVMAGLNCGTISSLAWPVLRAGCDAAIAIDDQEALRASDDLAAVGVSSGACGAAPLAGLRPALRDNDRRSQLDLPEDAVVVLLNTEARPEGRPERRPEAALEGASA